MSQYGPPVACFWIEPTDTVERYLRRYHHDEVTPGGWTCADGRYGHNARVAIDPVTLPIRTSREIEYDPEEVSGDRWPHDDERWPSTCERQCGYAFADTDVWQLFTERVYRAADGRWSGHLGQGGPPAGAMWDAWWMPEQWHGPDGLALSVQLPDGGCWLVDGPSSSGGKWTRTGDPKAQPPTVDVNPSILSGKPETYHGWLRHGQLVSV
jgi:hypothetical protein